MVLFPCIALLAAGFWTRSDSLIQRGTTRDKFFITWYSPSAGEKKKNLTQSELQIPQIIHHRRLVPPSFLFCLRANTCKQKNASRAAHERTGAHMLRSLCVLDQFLCAAFHVQIKENLYFPPVLWRNTTVEIPHLLHTRTPQHLSLYSPLAFCIQQTRTHVFPGGVWISYYLVRCSSGAELYERLEFCSLCHNSCSCASCFPSWQY